MKKTAFLLLILSFSLCLCTKPLYEGVVIEKRYTPALTYGQYGPPYDEYMLRIEGDKTKKVYVSKQTYDSIEVGDIYPIIE